MAGRVYARKNAAGKRTWYVDLRDGKGFRQRVACGALRRDAERVLAEFQAQLRLGATGAETTLLVGDLLRDHERHQRERYEAGDLKWASVRTVDDGNRRLLPFFESVTFPDLTPALWAEYEGERLRQPTRDGRPPSPYTIRAEFHVLRAALRGARRLGRITRDPLEDVRLGRRIKAKNPRRCPTRDEFRALVEAAPSSWQRVWLLLGLCGLRVGEALALRWKHVRGGDGAAHVSVDDSKTAAGVREVPLPLPVVEALGSRGGDETWVFPGRKGKALGVSSVDLAFKRYLSAADVPAEGLVVHSLRYYFASCAFEEGATLPEVKAMGGWTDTRTLMQIYAKASKEGRRGVADRLGTAWSDGGHKVGTRPRADRMVAPSYRNAV